jgi:anti-anti-sigma factor
MQLQAPGHSYSIRHSSRVIRSLLRSGKCDTIFVDETMDIQIETAGNRRIVRINDKITFEHCPALQSRLDAILTDDVREVAIDFKDVPFIDSSGIGEILRLFKLLRDRNGELVLLNPNRKLRELFSMYRFEKFMKIRDELGPARE